MNISLSGKIFETLFSVEKHFFESVFFEKLLSFSRFSKSFFLDVSSPHVLEREEQMASSRFLFPPLNIFSSPSLFLHFPLPFPKTKTKTKKTKLSKYQSLKTNEIQMELIDDSLTPIESEKRKEVELSVKGMTCASCANLIESVLGSEDGVCRVAVNLILDKAFVVYNSRILDARGIADLVSDLGFEAVVCC